MYNILSLMKLNTEMFTQEMGGYVIREMKVTQ